jgi:hypothetical protein
MIAHGDTDDTAAGPFGPISRRSAISSTLLAGAAVLTGQPAGAQEPRGSLGLSLVFPTNAG